MNVLDFLASVRVLRNIQTIIRIIIWIIQDSVSLLFHLIYVRITGVILQFN